MIDYTYKFQKILKQLEETYKTKNADYGDSFSQSINEFGLLAGVIRIGDKYNRLKNLALNSEIRQVEDETISDTLLDMANYCIMLKIENDKKDK